MYRLGVGGVPGVERFERDDAISAESQNAGTRAIRADGQPCRTLFARLESRSAGHALLEARPEGGRTHQIRIHAAAAGFPIVGDPAYGHEKKLDHGLSRASASGVSLRGGLMLHAHELCIRHPRTGDAMHWRSELPGWARDAKERSTWRSRRSDPA